MTLIGIIISPFVPFFPHTPSNYYLGWRFLRATEAILYLWSQHLSDNGDSNAHFTSTLTQIAHFAIPLASRKLLSHQKSRFDHYCGTSNPHKKNWYK